MTDLIIQWITPSKQEWDNYIAQCAHSTLLQTWYYAQAMRHVHKQGVRHGLIIIEGQKAGIFQCQDISLFKGAIHTISLDRGPLWFDGFGNKNHQECFANTFHHAFPDRFGRKRRFLPEYQAKKPYKIDKNWRKTKKIDQYKTYIVDLSTKSDKIRKNLKQKWRNILNKAEKNTISVQEDWNLSSFDIFLKHYTIDRAEKHYAAASTKFLAVLGQYAARSEDCLILNATDDGRVIAAIILFCHGQGATYQAGWTTPQGRDTGAHHLLLWRAIEILKQKGIVTLDLGGFNDETPGLKQFKAGLGGREIALIGSYH